MIAPCVVGVGYELSTFVIVYSNDISLHILTEPVGIKDSFGVRLSSIPHSNRSARRVVDKDENISVPLFGYYLCSVKVVGVLNSVRCLRSPYSLVIVGKCKALCTFCDRF